MKYIRTKNGKIYKTLEDYMQSDLLPTKIRVEEVAKDWHIVISKNQVINQADTIEELCDVFIRIKDRNNYRFFLTSSMEQVDGWENYGAIWTGKGLIFVAKMNDKGELELL